MPTVFKNNGILPQKCLPMRGYSDGHKQVVPTEDIKRFDPNNYKQDILYLVRWENSYYQAQVLLIKGTFRRSNFDFG